MSFADEDLTLCGLKTEHEKTVCHCEKFNSMLHWNSTVAASRVHVDRRRDDKQIAAREILITNKEEKNHSRDDEVLE